MRPISNPPNPYASVYREWLGPPPEARLEVYEEDARSIVSENDSPDLPFRWSVNPYRGCQHACAYCYARPYHEYLGFGAGTDFDSRICVKRNAPELLRRTLASPKWTGEYLSFSGVTDCYQPLEAVYALTRGCLEVCLELGNPLGIVTKSYLVVRDIDLLTALARRGLVRVYLSIPFADDALARRIEAGAPTPTRRFEALRRLHEAGVPVGVMVAPLIPGLNDREIPRVLERAAEGGASAAGYTALRLPGSVRRVFFERLKAELPERAARVEALIRQMRDGAVNETRFGLRMRGTGTYWRSVMQLFEQSARRVGISPLARECCAKTPAGALFGALPEVTAAAGNTGSAPDGLARAGSAHAPRARQLPLFDG